MLLHPEKAMATPSIKPKTTKMPTARQLLTMADRHENWARGLQKEAARFMAKAEKKALKPLSVPAKAAA